MNRQYPDYGGAYPADCEYDADYDADYDEEFDGEYSDEYDADRRWLWVAGVAGAILLVAVIATVVVVNSGDSESTAAKIATPATRPAVTPPPTPTASTPPLPPETVTTLTPSTAVSPTTTAATTAEAAPPPVADPRTIVYSVTGNKQLIDLITVIYTDEQGMPRTEFNVALPWTKSVVPNPDVGINSVTATSVAGQLNCTITDASGVTVAAQNNNTIIATCNR